MARGYVKCADCGKVLGKAGVTSHIRSIHPETFESFNNDKPAYYAANACNQDGSPMTATTTAPDKAPESVPTATTPTNDTPVTPAPAQGTGAGEAPTPDKSFRGPKPKSKDGLAGLFGYTD